MKTHSPHATYKAFDLAEARRIAEDLVSLEGPLLPILHALQDHFGYIDERAVPEIADVLNLSRADVHGVVSFYHDFRREPSAQHVVKVCRAEACQAMGAERVWTEIQAAFADNPNVTVLPVYCLGNCALSPAALVDGNLHGRIDADKARTLVGR